MARFGVNVMNGLYKVRLMYVGSKTSVNSLQILHRGKQMKLLNKRLIYCVKLVEMEHL